MQEVLVNAQQTFIRLPLVISNRDKLTGECHLVGNISKIVCRRELFDGGFRSYVRLSFYDRAEALIDEIESADYSRV